MVYSKFARWFKFILAIALGFGLITACRSTPHSTSSAAECRMIRHTRGETCVPLNPQRVVILFDPAIANALALGIKPVGITGSPAASGIETIHYLQEQLAKVEFVGNQSQPSLEKILRLKPDLILGVVYQENYAQLSQIAPTVMFEWEGTSYWRQHFHDIAAVFGKTEVAEQLMARYARRITELKTALGHRRTLKISCADYCCGGWRVDVKNSFVGSILNDAGLQRPAVQNVEVEGGLIELSEEYLTAMDGDVLFISTLGNDEERTALDELERKPLWSHLKAVQHKQVHLVDMSIWRGSHILATDLVIDDLFKYLVQKN